MMNEGISFTLVNINSETETFRLVVMKGGVVFDIVESNFRMCINRQLELLQQLGFTETKWRVRT